MKDLARVRRPEFAEGLYRREASLSWRFGIVDVTHRDFDGDVCPLAEGGDLYDRDTSLPRGRESQRRVRRNGRWNEDGSPPAGGFEKAV